MRFARENPFEMRRLHAIPFRFENDSWESLEARLQSLQGRGAIVGNHGSGKTQLLEEWQRRLKARQETVALVRLNVDRSGLPTELTALQLRRLSSQTWLMIDGAEQLSWWTWWRIRKQTRHCRALIVTVHRPCRLPTLLQCTANTKLLDELLDEILGSEAVQWQPIAHSLFRNFNGNLRDVWRALYDRYGSSQP